MQTLQTLPHWAQVVFLMIPGVSAVFAALALLINFGQSRRTNSQARAALVAGCLKGFTDDNEIQNAFYTIEYNEFVYDPKTFHQSKEEREIDKLLRHFANLALSWKNGLLTLEDIRPIRYYVVRIMYNPEIEKYMKFMEKWSQQAALGSHPYLVLVELSRKLSGLSTSIQQI